MNESSREKLQKLLGSLQMEADPIAMKLEEQHKEIFKLSESIDKLENNFSEDEFVFSPRANKSQNDQINIQKKKLDTLKKENDDLTLHYDKINENIDAVVDVLSSDNSNDVNFNGLVYQEQDRQRIARDLHDTALQNLSYLMEKIDKSIQFIEKDPIKAKMELSIAKQNLRDSVDDIRSIIYDLRPMVFDITCFKSVLLKLIEKINVDNKYLIDAEIEDVSCNNQLVITTIYRIVEECLINIKKHADAYKITIIFQEQGGYYYLYIEDDGKGFDQNRIELNDELHFGLNIIRERVSMLGGSLNIDTSKNCGTKIKVLIPIN